jgi:MoxR-like ATPase
MNESEPTGSLSSVREIAERVRNNVARVIVGKDAVIDLLLVALLCEGHVLLEDVPGIGKTTLAKALARSLDCQFARIQFTADLLPTDIVGINLFNQQTSRFEVRPGPIVTQILLADEINRAGPRTQAALLEAMEERQVTIEHERIALPRPFMVIATQNPVELAGTFPLPEAQLDRFLLRVTLGYPSEADERGILQRFREESPLDALTPVASTDEIQAMQRAIRVVHVEPVVEEYIVRLVRATRDHTAIELGASPRAALALYRTSQAWAALQGRAYILPDDTKRLAPVVLQHRLILRAQTNLRGHDVGEILAEVLAQVPAPVEEPST